MQNSSNGDDGELNVMSLHLCRDVPITLQTQHWRQVLLGSGKPERTTTYVVGFLTRKPLHIFEGIGSASDDFVSSQHLSCLIYRHVVLAKMHSVGTSKPHPLNMVVENECGMIFIA